MATRIIAEIEQAMLTELSNHQMERLHKVLTRCLGDLVAAEEKAADESQNEYLPAAFIAAKRVEGCSAKSLRYYQSTIQNMLNGVGKPVKHITTDDLRRYCSTE
jgi:hypothetical protein